jgi:hypothetical protein
MLCDVGRIIQVGRIGISEGDGYVRSLRALVGDLDFQAIDRQLDSEFRRAAAAAAGKSENGPPTERNNGDHDTSLQLVAGGFEYGGKVFNLTGRPLQLLEALLNAKHRRATVDQLRDKMGINDAAVEYPVQVVKDTASELRKVLKDATKCEDPLPSVGKAASLAYYLNLP